MPYGVDKKLGGDSKENDAWMERCVSSVMEKSGRSKSSAIAICKSQMRKSRNDKAEAETDVINLENILRNQFIKKIMKAEKKTFAQANAEYEAILAKYNFDLDLLFDR